MLVSVKITQVTIWRGDRVVDGNGLENRRGETHRGFESLPLRQVVHVGTPGERKLGGGYFLAGVALTTYRLWLTI